jgi:hypothetical protein
MSLTNTSKVLVLLIFVYASQAFAGAQATTANQPLETVSLCQLTQEWTKYDHKTVRIEAIYHADNEASEVYDPACPTSDHTAWVALIPYGSPSPLPPELKERLNELLKHNSRARITVVGEFAGPKKVDVPPGLSPEAAEAQRSTNSRYGHRNQWEFQFVFSKIEKVDPVPASNPWPRWASENKK